MKSMIAILALLGVASATFYGQYPEQQQFLGPFRHLYNQESINTPFFHKYGQTFPWNFQKTLPYSQYFNNYPYKTHFEYPTYEKNFVPEYVQGKYPIKDISLAKHLTVPTYMDKTSYEHGYPYYYPYGQEKFYQPIEKFIPFYEKYMPKHERFVPEFEKFMPKYEKFTPEFMPKHERFVPELEKFMPKYEKFVPEYEKFMPKYEKFVPEYQKFVPELEKFMPKYEKFVPEYEQFYPKYEKFVPKYEKFFPEHEKFVPRFVEPKIETEFKPTDKIVTNTLEAEKVVETPKIHEEKILKTVGEDKIHEKEFVYPKFEKFSPQWYKYFGYKHVPYHYETSEYYPKYFEQRPFHYGLY